MNREPSRETREQAVAAANEAFYRAFTTRDLPAMDRLWARAAEVACIHPGWAPCEGREAVMESWTGILANPESPKVRCLEAKVRLHGALGVVVCYEAIEGGYLVATNLFVEEAGGWKLVHHQAGPISSAPSGARTAPAPASQRLH